MMFVVELFYDGHRGYIEDGHAGYICTNINSARKFDKLSADYITTYGIGVIGYGSRYNYRLVKVT